MPIESADIYGQMLNSIAKNPCRFIEIYQTHPEIRQSAPWVAKAASQRGDVAIRFLLDQGHSPNERSDLYRSVPALEIAAAKGCLRCVQLLLDAGASINVESFDDNALFSAILAGSLDCATLLVEAGIDIHKTYTLS